MIPFGFSGFTCCLGGVALYLLSQSTGSVLKSITRVYHLKDLEQLVEEESLIIAVSGSIGSETPIKCEHSDMLGVFLKETAEKQVLRRNWMLSWVQDSTLMEPMTKEVPWYLDDGTGRVNVAVSQGELGLALTVGSDVFEKSEPVSLFQGTLDYLKGLKKLGVRSIEHVVPIGTPLTIVGEAVKDGIGDIKIQKPEHGPFYVSHIPLDQLILKLGKQSRRFKYASMGLTVLGLILLSKPVIEYILKRIEDTPERRRARRRELLRRSRLVDAAARGDESVTRGSIGTARAYKNVSPGLERLHENSSNGTSRDGDVRELCVVCLEQKYNAAFVQCGHMCCCITCSSRLRTCPLCRRPIQQVLKIYRH